MAMPSFKQFLLELLPPASEKQTAPAIADKLILSHGSNNSELKLQDIEIIRTSGQKQAKKGRIYGGLYCVASDDPQAGHYASMVDGTPTTYKIKIKDGVKIYQTDSSITRLTPEVIHELINKGYGILVGKDPIGKHTEWVIVDKAAIASLST